MFPIKWRVIASVWLLNIFFFSWLDFVSRNVSWRCKTKNITVSPLPHTCVWRVIRVVGISIIEKNEKTSHVVNTSHCNGQEMSCRTMLSVLSTFQVGVICWLCFVNKPSFKPSLSRILHLDIAQYHARLPKWFYNVRNIYNKTSWQSSIVMHLSHHAIEHWLIENESWSWFCDVMICMSINCPCLSLMVTHLMDGKSLC